MWVKYSPHRNITTFNELKHGQVFKYEYEQNENKFYLKLADGPTIEGRRIFNVVSLQSFKYQERPEGNPQVIVFESELILSDN
jgi:hypothetical protein